jgi:hypothetical protein
LDRPKVSLLGLALISLVLFTRCATGGTTIGWTDNGAPIVNTSQAFPVLDNRGILHEYKSDSKTYKRITHPSTDKLTLYCGVHFQWETLRIQWKRSNLTNIGHREENSFWRWTYIVTRNKKQ